MVDGHRIEKEISADNFLSIIKNYSGEEIHCTNHTFFRLSEKQRKIFKCEHIKDYLLLRTPYLAGIQRNKCYAVFYRYQKKRFIRIILNISPKEIEIVTFYIIEHYQLPKLK